jgi:CheY-like chemotaxis protein
MPGIDGFTACRRIKDLIGKTKTRIVACTAQPMASLNEDIYMSGMDGFIEKPM